jgi:hypothetical protein
MPVELWVFLRYVSLAIYWFVLALTAEVSISNIWRSVHKARRRVTYLLKETGARMIFNGSEVRAEDVRDCNVHWRIIWGNLWAIFAQTRKR